MKQQKLKKIIQELVKDKSNWAKIIKIYEDYQAPENGMLLDSTIHNQYDKKELILHSSPSPKFINLKTNIEIDLIFVPYNSFIYRKDLYNYRNK